MTKDSPATMTRKPHTAVGVDSRANTLAAVSAALCGVGLLWVVGFSHLEVLHNVAHDTRHSQIFPCH
jgi:cobalt transporter subunit CbtB